MKPRYRHLGNWNVHVKPRGLRGAISAIASLFVWRRTIRLAPNAVAHEKSFVNAEVYTSGPAFIDYCVFDNSTLHRGPNDRVVSNLFKGARAGMRLRS